MIEFAPVDVPLKRRLETLAVLVWGNLFLFTGLATVISLLYCLFYTSFLWPFAIAYIAWYLYDLDTCNKGGRRSKWLRNAGIWKHYADYFPVKLVQTAELDPKKGNYLLGSHPHGILCSGAFASFATEGAGFSTIFKGLTPYLLTLEGFHQVPGFREILMLSGACAATSKSIDHLLGTKENGRAVVLVVGGAREVLCQDQERIELIIAKRKGFIKKALKHGSFLVPTFSFGEAFIYGQLIANPKGSLIRTIQERILDKIRFPFPFFLGRGIFQYTFGYLPRRHPITVVVGKPIHVGKNENPSVGEIDALHKKYMDELQALYSEYNPMYGDPKVALHFT